MPQPKADLRKRASAKDVKSAANVGDAQFSFFQKYGTFPTSKSDLQEFLH
jgi:hypothetical protein